jgi:hypothetical protein
MRISGLQDVNSDFIEPVEELERKLKGAESQAKTQSYTLRAGMVLAIVSVYPAMKLLGDNTGTFLAYCGFALCVVFACMFLDDGSWKNAKEQGRVYDDIFREKYLDQYRIWTEKMRELGYVTKNEFTKYGSVIYNSDEVVEIGARSRWTDVFMKHN